MFVVQIYLPLELPDGTQVPAGVFERTKAELTDRFGGEPIHDRIAIFEVMVADVDTAWWRQYREALESELKQQRILVRLFQVTVL